MEETEKPRLNVKLAKDPFDESKLTPPQLRALAIARQQGAKFSRSLSDLTLDVEPHARNELVQAIVEHRLQDRIRSRKLDET